MLLTKIPKTSGNATVSLHSAETIAENDDLLNEILLRLPITTLIKFKSVSKHWLSLISDPNFSRRRNPYPNSASGLFVTHWPEFEFVNLDKTTPKSNPFRGTFRSVNFAHDSIRIVIVQSCNGLLLCSTNLTLEPKQPKPLYIYNPTTNQYRILPPLPPSPNRDSVITIYGFSLAFDPSKSPHYYVVCVRTIGVDTLYQIVIYSSETRRWKLSGDTFYFDCPDLRTSRGVFWNGSVHWINSFQDSLYFNVEEEKLNPMPMPPFLDGRGYMREYMYFGESMGHLHLIDKTFNPQTPCLDVYEMEMDYSGWFVKFRVDFSEFPIAYPETIEGNNFQLTNLDDYKFSVLCVVRSEVEEESYLVLQIKGKIIGYNFKTRTFRKICDVEVGDLFQWRNSVLVRCPELSEWYDVYQFIESFAFV